MGLFGFKKKPAGDGEEDIQKKDVAFEEEAEKKETKVAPVKAERKVPVKKEKKAKETKEVSMKGKYPESARILIRPLVTEKTTDMGIQGKYGFEVDKRANRIEVARAVEGLYGVRPTKVNIINVSGKRVRHGRISGRTKNWKKAVVTLREGDKIEIFEGV